MRVMHAGLNPSGLWSHKAETDIPRRRRIHAVGDTSSLCRAQILIGKDTEKVRRYLSHFSKISVVSLLPLVYNDQDGVFTMNRLPHT